MYFYDKLIGKWIKKIRENATCQPLIWPCQKERWGCDRFRLYERFIIYLKSKHEKSLKNNNRRKINNQK